MRKIKQGNYQMTTTMSMMKKITVKFIIINKGNNNNKKWIARAWKIVIDQKW